NYGNGLPTVTSADSAGSTIYADTGYYYAHVTATTKDGCVQKDSLRVYVEGVDAIIDVDSSKANAGMFTFFNKSVKGKTYTWNFGDGTPEVTTTDMNAVPHTYTSFTGDVPEGDDGTIKPFVVKETKQYDIIIVGAGASGLIAGWELAQTGKKVLILEAKKRCGGRIHTIKDEAFPTALELGAEFVHGKLPITQQLIKKAGGKWHKIKGSLWHNLNGKWIQSEEQIPNEAAVTKALEEVTEDMTISQFLDTYFADNKDIREGLTSYIEGYYAGDINKVSTFAFRDEMKEGDDRQYRIDGGYKTIMDYLVKMVRKQGVTIQLQTPVNSIEWQPNYVKLIAGTKSYQGKKALVTVPLGVLQAQAIQFSPGIDTLNSALS
ncbi:MAG: FAD-dependent oxidoreductase, partial [Pedobacter sp.]